MLEGNVLHPGGHCNLLCGNQIPVVIQLHGSASFRLGIHRDRKLALRSGLQMVIRKFGIHQLHIIPFIGSGNVGNIHADAFCRNSPDNRHCLLVGLFSVSDKHNLCTFRIFEQRGSIGMSRRNIGCACVGLFRSVILPHDVTDLIGQLHRINLIVAEGNNSDAVTVILSHVQNRFHETIPFSLGLLRRVRNVHQKDNLVFLVGNFIGKHRAGKRQNRQCQHNQVQHHRGNPIPVFPILFGKPEIKQSGHCHTEQENQQQQRI